MEDVGREDERLEERDAAEPARLAREHEHEQQERREEELPEVREVLHRVGRDDGTASARAARREAEPDQERAQAAERQHERRPAIGSLARVFAEDRDAEDDDQGAE